MKRLAKYLSLTAVVVLLLLGAGGWIVNRWLQSADGRAAIENRLSKSLRMPVKIKALTFSVWSGLTAGGVSVPGPFGDAFEAATISVGHRLTSILLGNLAFGEVRIEQPRLRIVQEASSEQRLPLVPPSPTATPASVATTSVTPAAPLPASAAAPPAPEKKRQFAVKRIVLNGGAVEFVDQQNRPVANLTGVEVTLNDVSERGFSGLFEAAQVTLHGYGAAGNVTGVVSQRDTEFRIHKLVATSGGGSVTGAFSRARGSTAAASLTFDRVNIAQAAQAAGVAAPKLSGTISCHAQLAGLGGDAKAVTGSGVFTLKNGTCREIELMRQIGEVLQLQSVANFEITEAKVNFRVADERVAISPMQVSAPPLGMELTGIALFDGTLDLSAILHAPADFINQRGMIANQFSLPDQDNRRGVQFNITGPLKKPKHNLAERVTGTKDKRWQRIIAAEAIISALTGKKKQTPKVEQPPAVPQPTPAQP